MYRDDEVDDCVDPSTGCLTAAVGRYAGNFSTPASPENILLILPPQLLIPLMSRSDVLRFASILVALWDIWRICSPWLEINPAVAVLISSVLAAVRLMFSRVRKISSCVLDRAIPSLDQNVYGRRTRMCANYTVCRFICATNHVAYSYSLGAMMSSIFRIIRTTCVANRNCSIFDRIASYTPCLVMSPPSPCRLQSTPIHGLF